MVSGGYSCHSQRYGILRYQNLRTSPRHLAVPQTAYVHIGFRLLWAGAAAWMTNTNMASGAITDHSGPLRMSHLKWNFLHLPSLLLPRAWGLPWSHGRFGAWVCVCLSSRLLYTMQPTQLGIDSKTLSANLSAVTAITSPVPPTSLHRACAAPVFYLSHLSIGVGCFSFFHILVARLITKRVLLFVKKALAQLGLFLGSSS